MAKKKKTDQKKLEEMHIAVANTTLVWAELENAFCLLLSEYISGTIKQNPLELAGAIFFAPTSLEARINIADKAFKVAVQHLPEKRKLVPIWDRMIIRINRAKTTRNLVAHGQIAHISLKTINGYRIVPPAYDPRFHSQFPAGQTQWKSVNDLKQSKSMVKEIVAWIYRFRDVFLYYWADKAEEYAQAVLELQEADQKNTQAGGQRSRSVEEDPKQD